MMATRPQVRAGAYGKAHRERGTANELCGENKSQGMRPYTHTQHRTTQAQGIWHAHIYTQYTPPPDEPPRSPAFEPLPHALPPISALPLVFIRVCTLAISPVRSCFTISLGSAVLDSEAKSPCERPRNPPARQVTNTSHWIGCCPESWPAEGRPRAFYL